MLPCTTSADVDFFSHHFDCMFIYWTTLVLNAFLLFSSFLWLFICYDSVFVWSLTINLLLLNNWGMMLNLVLCKLIFDISNFFLSVWLTMLKLRLFLVLYNLFTLRMDTVWYFLHFSSILWHWYVLFTVFRLCFTILWWLSIVNQQISWILQEDEVILISQLTFILAYVFHTG